MHRTSTPPISIAPMMERTDRHYRYMMRQITQHTLLYTEMITTGALLNGDVPRHLSYHADEHPLALQLGGDSAKDLATCAKMAEDWGYDEVNLNVGCPSNRVQSGSFGAALMGHPEKVAEAVTAMRKSCSLPVTVKHRIGIDEIDRYEDMLNFVRIVADTGCDRFTVHARKAWLQGLSPKENRNVPPLRYGDVHRLKKELPDLQIEINGGFTDWDTVQTQLKSVDAVMLGRAAYDNPWMFASVDEQFFGSSNHCTRQSVVESMISYAEKVLRDDPHARLGHIARHMQNLFNGQPGARNWRRKISEQAFKPDAAPDLLLAAIPPQK
jgi:tRNA-dihydrouridine synthase A